VIPIDERIAWRYARISRDGRARGHRIGDNDLWIAATALERGIPLLTRNIQHFSRIPGLIVENY
jgi:predicted nucleic acid-binding protein